MKRNALMGALVFVLCVMFCVTSVSADVGAKTKKAIQKVNASIKTCEDAAEVLAEWADNFYKNAKAFQRDNVEIMHFDADSQSHTSFTRRSKTWRQVKDKLKSAIKKYNSKCKKITGKLKAIDKLKDKKTGAFK